MAATNLIALTIYKIGSTGLYPGGLYMDFPSTGINVFPVTGAQTVGTAILYARVNTPGQPGMDFYTDRTVAQILTATNS